MANNPDAIYAALRPLLDADARDRLLAKGLARGMIWRQGRLPPGGPSFPDTLSDDLLHFGYGVLALALELREATLAEPDKKYDTEDAFRVAAESIESAMRRGDPSDASRGFHLVVAAAAFHLAGFAARSYVLLPSPDPSLNLSSAELALCLLLRREMYRLRRHIVESLADLQKADSTIAARLADQEDDLDSEEAVVIVLTNMYLRALGLADTVMYFGDAMLYREVQKKLEEMIDGAAQVGNIPLWWVGTLSRHLFGDLWGQSLHIRIPLASTGNAQKWLDLRKSLIQSLSVGPRPHIDLWPSQLTAAARSVDINDDLIVSLPTSSGKTRIAELCILRTLADEKRIIYVTPLRALSAQLEKTLARTFTPLDISVTSLYGASGMTMTDTATLQSAQIVVATPEKLDFAIRQDPEVLDDVGLIVFDEGHMIGLGSREIRYEVLIQRLLRRSDANERRIVCLSAMFNADDDAFKDFTQWLRSDEEGEPIHVNWRPTRQLTAFLNWKGTSGRLQFREGEKPFIPKFIRERSSGESRSGRRKKNFPKNGVELCIAAANAFASDGHNVLVYSPERRSVESLVTDCITASKQGYLDGVHAPENAELMIAMAIGREWLGEKHPAVAGLKIGVGAHHGALPRPFLGAVEDLLNRKVLPIVVASPTLAQGIDLACSALIFKSITRFSPKAKKQLPISAAEFANVVGRVGRAYVDIDGIAVFPIYENIRFRQQQFTKLASEAKSQTLWSGLAHLVYEITQVLAVRFKLEGGPLLEHIVNQRDFWADERLRDHDQNADGDDASEGTLEDYLADLDVALFSLVEPLETPDDELADIIDSILRSSLWERTVIRLSPMNQRLEKNLLVSRAAWLWRTTSVPQRKACFSSGLGKESGVFLYDNLEVLVEMLTRFQEACEKVDEIAVGEIAVEFADYIMQCRFFSARKPPREWQKVLRQWVTGQPFAEILSTSSKKVEKGKIQTFIQDAVVFKLVWAAEAVRAQAQMLDHAKAGELGDAAALALTYGVPSVAAALLCQRGFASRTGALWAVRQLPEPNFFDTYTLRDWLYRHQEVLADAPFWDSKDQFLLWNAQHTDVVERVSPWKRSRLQARVKWEQGVPPPEGSRVRLINHQAGQASVCSETLERLGEVHFNSDITDAYLTGVIEGGDLFIEAFGPEKTVEPRR